jgi:hypothetical protein
MANVASRTAVEFSVAFGGQSPSRLENMAATPLLLTEPAIEYLTYTARTLRAIASPTRRTLRGKIIELKSNLGLVSDDTEEENTAVMRWSSEGIRVRLQLTPDDYRKAVEAHIARRDVIVNGILEKIGKVHRLTESGSLEIAP